MPTGKITDEQRVRIYAMAGEMGISNDSLHKRVAKVLGKSQSEISFSASKDNALTKEEGDIIEEKVAALLKKHKANIAEAPDDSAGLAMKACMDIINGLVKGMDEGNVFDAYAECGIQSLGDIEDAKQADAVIAALEKRK